MTRATYYLVRALVALVAIPFHEAGHALAALSCFDIPPHLCLGALSPQKVTVIFNHPKKGFLAFDVKNLALSSALFDFIEYIQEDETFTLPEETSRKVVQETLEKLRAQQR